MSILDKKHSFTLDNGRQLYGKTTISKLQSIISVPDYQRLLDESRILEIYESLVKQAVDQQVPFLPGCLVICCLICLQRRTYI